MSALAPLLEGYFRDHLGARRASVHTVSSYRDSFRRLVTYAASELRKAPVELELADLDTELIGAFLDHLERDRHVSVRTRNSRLGAIRSLYTYASYRCSEDLGVIRRVLAIPAKAREHTLVTFLEDAEVAALIETPDQATRLGRRDHALLVVGIETGLRVSELTGLRFADVSFGRGANVYTLGKGRRERITPLRPTTAKLLEAWQGELRSARDAPVFPARTGGRLSTDAVKDLLDKHVSVASEHCHSLSAKTVTPHTLRHTCAMRLLRSGADPASIALWLGHASIKSTEIYFHADLRLKEDALRRMAPTPAARHRYRPNDALLDFLEGL
jgi:site-specific recombinase XerD